jgi:two-component system sensor histidine kinase KdpD
VVNEQDRRKGGPSLEDDAPLKPATLLALRRLEEEKPSSRGRLRILLGAAPGVGKTYAMLLEGRRLKSEGEDVVVGLVETYGRKKTEEAVGDLEIVPLRKYPYRNVVLDEMDTDAIIARNPDVVLVDELAHTNAPSSRFQRRWEDVEAIRDAGIDVISTVNIQHLESLNDIIRNITGVTVRETIPDSVVDAADELQLVDVPVEVLQERLRKGEIYPPERAERALQNYFRKGNLAALREMALRRIALEVEEDIESSLLEEGISDSFPSHERILVVIDHSLHAREVVRHAARMARGYRAQLMAVAVCDPSKLNESDQHCLTRNIRIAEDLGAELVSIPTRDVGKTVADLARKHNITEVVLGQPPRSRWEILLQGSVINTILRDAPTVDVHVVADRGRG